ncbi:restriction endonuclease subunit S [Vibrio splendidus]|uniref:restriction endonuclease subunit S n=1 Tax=Vibrio splendidus TaxID=29497 RepID=UPI000C839B83|nr:restriction endonuclease subunit S [Vibrio splendidus]PMP37033.1 type I restriction endonuclease subunit S [Vibrio splendidus]
MSWPVIALEDLCHTVTKGTTPTSIGYNFASEGIPFLRIQNLKGNSVDLEDVLYIDSSTHQALKRSMIKAGDLLITIAGTIGRTAIVPSHFPDCNCNQAVAIIRFDTEKLLPLYLLYWLNSVDAKSQIAGKKVTATISNLSLGQIKNLKIPLPPLETQKQIAAVLEKADQLRKDCQQMEQELNSLAQSVFIDMFGDPLINPKGWQPRTLNEFYASKKTGTKCGPFGSALKKEEFIDSGVPVWNMSNISLTGEFIDNPTLWITEDKYKELESYEVLQGDVIISRAGTVGKMGVVSSEYDRSIISTNLIRVRFGVDLLPLYFVCLMTYCKTRLKRLKVGDDGSFSHMNTGILDNIEFPYPPMEEQLKYMKFREHLDIQLSNLNQLKYEQEASFNGIMQKAFKGELNL